MGPAGHIGLWCGVVWGGVVWCAGVGEMRCEGGVDVGCGVQGVRSGSWGEVKPLRPTMGPTMGRYHGHNAGGNPSVVKTWNLWKGCGSGRAWCNSQHGELAPRAEQAARAA
jgi:hypothetical protein